MATRAPAGQKRQALMQAAVSAVVGLLALVVLLRTQPEGITWWLLFAVAASSAVEAVWFGVKYVRLSREDERLI